MTLNIDDVMEVLKVVRECKDTELHIDTGEMKLSLVKGKVNASGSFFGPAAEAPPDPVPRAVEPAAGAAAAEPEPAVADETPAQPATTAGDAGAEPEEGLVQITASVTSVFYRRPSPEEDPFVELGDEVEEDTVLCLLEVMKCFRQVLAGLRGRVEKICVENNSMVEEGTVLFLIRPE